MKRLVLISMMLLSAYYGALACENNDCEELFKKATDKVRSLRLVGTGRGFNSVYQVTVTGEDGSINREKVEFGALRDKYFYKTSQLDFYQDQKTLVMIHHDEKIIYLTGGKGRKREEDQHSAMIKLLDSLQKYLVFQGCSREFGTVHPGKGYTHVTFSPGAKLKSSGLKSIGYWLDADELAVRKIMVNYTPGSGYGVQKYEMVVDEMNISPSRDPYAGAAVDKVFRNNKVRQEYKSYRIIDKRS